MTWQGKPSPRKKHLQDQGVSGWEQQRRVKHVLERDQYVCYLRGPNCIGTATIADHVIPLHKGGSAAEDNMRAACAPCHRAKTKQETTEARRQVTHLRRPEPHPGLIRPPDPPRDAPPPRR